MIVELLNLHEIWIFNGVCVIVMFLCWHVQMLKCKTKQQEKEDESEVASRGQ